MPHYSLNTKTDGDRGERAPQEVMLEGQLFLFAEQSVFACTVTHLSTSTAVARCAEAPPLSSAVLLYVEGFGRLHAVTRRFAEGLLEMRLELNDGERKKLAEQLDAFRDGDIVEVTRIRKHKRVPMAFKSQFIRTDGSVVPCTIADFSLAGLYLKTSVRPPIGECITIGDQIGVVVRHDRNGIGIAFDAIAEQKLQ